MALLHWEPVRELSTIQSEMNRLFNTFFEPGQTGGSATAASRRWVPAMDLVERGGEYLLRADLPGLTQSDVKIELENNVLTISGERKAHQEQKGEGYYRIERSFGSFSRSLTLPEGVDPQAITARFENGVLEVGIPKPEQRKPHRVEISVGGTERQAVETTAQDTKPEPAAVAAGNGQA